MIIPLGLHGERTGGGGGGGGGYSEGRRARKRGEKTSRCKEANGGNRGIEMGITGIMVSCRPYVISLSDIELCLIQLK